jgi:hypothetical protein
MCCCAYSVKFIKKLLLLYYIILIWFCDSPISTNFAIGVDGLEVFAKEIIKISCHNCELASIP